MRATIARLMLENKALRADLALAQHERDGERERANEWLGQLTDAQQRLAAKAETQRRAPYTTGLAAGTLADVFTRDDKAKAKAVKKPVKKKARR